MTPDRPVNLYEPADADHDEGARGIFADQAGGFLDPSFLTSLPTTALTFARAAAGLGQEKAAWLRRTDAAQQTMAAAGVTAAAAAVAAAGRAWRATTT